MIPTFTMLCGIPGSGKSTWAATRGLRNIVHSSDEIRRELGDVNDQSKNATVFEILHRRIKEDLRNGYDVIYDATNLNRKRRIHFINQELKGINCIKSCVIFATPYDVCVQRDEAREKKVGKDVILRMIKNFEIPCTQEGWGFVTIEFAEKHYTDYNALVKRYMRYDQNSKHHSLTLGEHMLSAAFQMDCSSLKYPYDKEEMLRLAAFYHDCGKPLCKAFTNGKGEHVDSATYYGHDNVSAYEAMSILHDLHGMHEDDIQEVCLLINYHMKPYTSWKENPECEKRDENFLGNHTYKMICELHKADLKSH